MTQLYSTCSIVNPGVPTFTGGYNDGKWQNAITAGPVGDVTLANIAGSNIATTGFVALPQSRGVLAASGLQTIGALPGTGTARQTCLREGGAGGASGLTDYNFDLFVASLTDLGTAHVVAMGILLAGVTPSWAFATGAIDQTTIGRTAAGDYTINLLSSSGVNAAASIVLCQPMAPQVASGLRGQAVDHTSNTAKRITMSQEGGGGAASGLTDYDLGIVILGLGKRATRAGAGSIFAAFSVISDTVTPTYRFASGAINSTVAIGRASAGVYAHTFTPGQGLPTALAGGAIPIVKPRIAQGASELTSSGIGRPTEGTLEVTTGQEDAGGLASNLFDVDYDCIIFAP